MSTDNNTVLIRPRITEKATVNSEKAVYVFEVETSANKTQIARAIKSLYKVTPVKVATVSIAQENVIVRGKRGKKAAYKKAYVYLKKGDTIEIV